MEEFNPRFRCLPELSGTWMVWDDETGAPAMLDSCVLNGRSEERARTACEMLKRIYQNRLDAYSVRQSSRHERDKRLFAAVALPFPGTSG